MLENLCIIQVTTQKVRVLITVKRVCMEKMLDS